MQAANSGAPVMRSLVNPVLLLIGSFRCPGSASWCRFAMVS